MSNKAKKLELESSPEQLSQVKIEFRSRSSSASSNAGSDSEPHISQTNPDGFTEIKVEDEIEFGATSISVQSIPAAYNDTEQHNYQPIHGWSTAIKVECEVDINVEDEKEFCDPSSTAQSIPGTDDEEIEDEMEFSDELETDAETKVSDEYSKNPHEFSCDICSKKFSKKSNLKKHRLRHGKPDFHCSICGVAKFQQSELKRHMRTHESNRTCFTCDICSKKCISESNLKAHRLRHGKPNFHCTVCGVNKFTKYHLDLHMRTHDTNRIYVTCDICTKKILETNFSNHQKLHGKLSFKCGVCGVAKISQLAVNRHMKMHDINRKYFTCDICSKKFSNKTILNEHRHRHGKPNFNCSVCGVAKFRQAELKLHMRTHDTNPIFFACDICSKKCSSKSVLTAHRRRHDKPKFHCTVCDVSKFRKFELTTHMKVHNAK